MNGKVPFRIFPVVAVEGTSTTLPSGVTRDSITVIRESLSFTAVATAPKLPFTSDAFACVPAVKVVRGPTGLAWPSSITNASSAATPRIVAFDLMACPFSMRICRSVAPYSAPVALIPDHRVPVARRRRSGAVRSAVAPAATAGEQRQAQDDEDAGGETM